MNLPRAALPAFPTGFRALVIGASGGIGAAFTSLLQAHPQCGHVECLHRNSEPPINFDHEESIARAAAQLGRQSKFHLVINAVGVLHSTTFMPEKKLSDLHYAQLMDTFRVNTFGPALALRHFTPLLDPARAVFAVISAKVGSIGDNRLGGWYSYRASKAALNMLLKTASIEVKRTQPNAVLVALHPGTVQSRLSRPFRDVASARPALDAARDMLAVLEQLSPADSGKFLSYKGEDLPW